MSVRRLGPEDYDAMMELWHRSGLHSLRPQGRDSRESVASQFASGAQIALGVEDGGRLIALVLATHDGRKGGINRLAVDPERRGEGHGTLLIREAERVLREQGMGIIGALIENWNERSLELFQREGYTLHADILYLSKRDDPAV